MKRSKLKKLPTRLYPITDEPQARMSLLNMTLDWREGVIDNATYARARKKLLKRWPKLKVKISRKKTTVKTPPVKLAFPTAVDPKAGVGEAALYGKAFVNVPGDATLRAVAATVKPAELTGRQLIAGGRAAYDAWVREAGYAKDARIKPYDKLKVYSHPRWERIARDVYNAIKGAA